MAIWIGGLGTLVTIVLRRADSAGDTRRVGQRRYQAWRGVGAWDALADTTYGRLLLAKIAGMCALMALGNLARQRLRQLRVPVSAIVAAQATAVPENLLLKGSRSKPARLEAVE